MSRPRQWVVVAAIVAAILFAGLRVGGFRSPAFQGFAHLYVGGLFGAWLGDAGRGWAYLGLALSAVELACFLFLPK